MLYWFKLNIISANNGFVLNTTNIKGRADLFKAVGIMKIKGWINWIKNYERFREIMRLYKHGSIGKKRAFDLMMSAFDMEE